MLIRPPDKRSARELQRAHENVARKTPLAVVATEVIGASVSHAYVLAGALVALVGIAASQLARRAEKQADDPPRKDFTKQTEVSLRSIDFEAMLRRAGRQLLPEGREVDIVTGRPRTTLLEDRLSDVARHSFRAADYLTATVRAFERAQGAAEADSPGNASSRAAEARGFAHQAAQSLDTLAVRAGGVPDAIERDEQLPAASSARSVVEQIRPANLDEYLSDASMALLFEAGIRIEEVRAQVVRVVHADPWRAAGAAIASAGGASAGMARELRAWDPLLRG
jgi:hypothetical protein